jgi:hypothetical protein
MDFHEKFHDIKFANVVKREDEKALWDVRRVSSP